MKDDSSPRTFGTKSTILIVDDDVSIHDLLKALLFREYNLAFASDGPEALAKAAELIPDLILLDVMMPGMTGFEVCQHLRADPLLAEVPIIMVTALDDRDSRIRGLEAKADDFISKPFDPAELRARVRTVTQLNRYRRLLSERVKLEWVVEHANDGYLIVNRQDQVTYANPQAQLYLGLSEAKNDLPSKTFKELAQRQYYCEPQEAWATWPDVAPVDAQSPLYIAPLYLVRPETPTANAFWLQVSVLDVSPGAGRETSRIIRLQDVTEKTALQNELGKFHSLILHKLRTPLVPIYSNLQFLAMDVETLPREDIAAFVQEAFQAIERLSGEIEDILQYLNAPAIAQPGEAFSLSDLESLVNQVGASLELQAVTVSGQDELADTQMPLSRRSLDLILWEILENAKKFHPHHTPSAEIHLSRSGPHQVRIQISDDGLTLSPQQLARMWTPYYQADKFSTGQIAGMGLGLSLVAIQVWNVGGTCRAFNREGGPGIVVELVLPLCE